MVILLILFIVSWLATITLDEIINKELMNIEEICHYFIYLKVRREE